MLENEQKIQTKASLHTQRASLFWGDSGVHMEFMKLDLRNTLTCITIPHAPVFLLIFYWSDDVPSWSCLNMCWFRIMILLVRGSLELLCWLIAAGQMEWWITGNVSERVHWKCTIHLIWTFSVSPQAGSRWSVSGPLFWWTLSVPEQWGSGFTCGTFYGKFPRWGPRSELDWSASFQSRKESWYISCITLPVLQYTIQ